MDTVIVSGFFEGLIYGLLAVGLVVVYRGSRVVNFAFGQTGMVAAMVFTDLRTGDGADGFATSNGSLWLALPLSVALAALIGAATELCVVRTLREAPRIQPMVGTFAVGALLFVFAGRRWDTLRVMDPLVEGDGVTIAGLRVSSQQLLILAVTVAILVVLWLVYTYSAFGLRLRATALDPEAAGLSGVNVDLTSLLTWSLGGALAGLSAILVAPQAGALNIGFMVPLMTGALAAALVGGLTNLGGAFVGGVVIAIVQNVIAYESPISGIEDASVALFVLLLVLFRPAGLVRSAY